MTTTAHAHLKHEALVGGVSNAVFNGLICWLLIKGGPSLAWGGEHSFAVDIIATGLLLPLIVAAIVIPLQRSKLKKGKLQAISLGEESILQRIANRYPQSTGKSALLFGLTGLLVVVPLTLLALYLAGVALFTPIQYAIFKGIWAGIMAAILVLPMVLVALREPATSQN